MKKYEDLKKDFKVKPYGYTTAWEKLLCRLFGHHPSPPGRGTKWLCSRCRIELNVKEERV